MTLFSNFSQSPCDWPWPLEWAKRVRWLSTATARKYSYSMRSWDLVWSIMSDHRFRSPCRTLLSKYSSKILLKKLKIRINMDLEKYSTDLHHFGANDWEFKYALETLRKSHWGHVRKMFLKSSGGCENFNFQYNKCIKISVSLLKYTELRHSNKNSFLM